MSERAFVFADLAGYTALTEVHGDEDAARIATRFHELARQCLPSGTELVKTIGDAVMLASQSVADAIHIALALAKAVANEPSFPALRIGIHVGPVVERDGDYFGTTVNVAARVAGVARGREIVCTTPIAVVAAELDIVAAHPLGPVRLKNIATPVELYRLGDGDAKTDLYHLDPVCRMHVTAGEAGVRLDYEGVTIYFCSAQCSETFGAAPESYLGTVEGRG